MSDDYGRKRLQLCGARLRERSAPQVYIPRIEPRATWGRGGRYLKILGNTVEAHLRGGGLECFLDYDDATKDAPDKLERLETNRPGCVAMFRRIKKLKNISIKLAEAHHKHHGFTGASKGKVEWMNQNIHRNVVHAKGLRGKKSESLLSRFKKTQGFYLKVLEDSKKFNMKLHVQSMKHVLPLEEWLETIVKAEDKVQLAFLETPGFRKLLDDVDVDVDDVKATRQTEKH